MAEYYVDPSGNDNNNGISKPWKTLKFALGKESTLQAGDTLYLGRKGKESVTFFETNIQVRVKGDPGNPIHIKNCKGCEIIIDGKYDLPRKNWVADNSQPGLYSAIVDNASFRESVKKKKVLIHGTFTYKKKHYALIPYKDLESLKSTTEYYDEGGYYAGPGVFIEPLPKVNGEQNKDKSKIYLRLQAPDSHAVLGIQNTFKKGQYSLDPSNKNETEVSLVIHDKDSGCFIFFKDDSSFCIQGIKFINQPGTIFKTQGGSFNHFTLKDIVVESPSTLLKAGNTGTKIDPETGEEVANNSQHITLDCVRVDRLLPPWIAFGDVKSKPGVASRFMAETLELSRAVHNVTIRRCLFRNMFDVVYPVATLHSLRSDKETTRALAKVPDWVLIEDCTFENILDDAILLDWASREIRIRYNTFINVSAPISKQGGAGKKLTLQADELGRVYIHHNLFICRSKFNSRRKSENGNEFNPFKLAGPLSTIHSPEAAGYSPWKIYHNTIHVHSHVGFQPNLIQMGVVPKLIGNLPPDPDLPPDRKYKQEVYNNIFILEGNSPMMRDVKAFNETDIYDGNIYYRTDNSDYFAIILRTKADRVRPESLEKFKKCFPNWEQSGIEADPCLKLDYTPIAGGEAATNGVDVSAFGWDGVQEKLAYRGAFPVPGNQE